MSLVSSRTGSVLLPLLAAALLVTACSDSTGPSPAETGPSPVETAGRSDEQLPSGTPSLPPAAVQAQEDAGTDSASAMVKVAESQTSNLVGVGALHPCRWNGAWCLRWFEIDDPVWLELAIQWVGDYAIVWERIHLSGQPWQQRYAVSTSDLSVYLWLDQQWHRYAPYGVNTSSTTFVLNVGGECGGLHTTSGALCSHGMLDVQSLLLSLAWGI